MNFTILGPVTVAGDDGPIALPGKIRQALLAMLVLNHGQVVSRDVMVDRLWAENPPPTATNTLQSHMSGLRRALRADPNPIVSQPPGYVLHTPPDTIDLVRFESLRTTGRLASAAGELEAASDHLRAACALFQGDPLTGLDDFAFARDAATRLREDHLVVLEDRIDVDLELGRHRELISELDALALQHPASERIAAQLLLAFYRSGRQAAALQAFQRTRTYLREELGLEPSVLLSQLEQAVLRQDPALDLRSAAGPGTVGVASWAAETGPSAERRRPTTASSTAPARDADAANDLETLVAWSVREGSPFVGRQREIELLGGVLDHPNGVRLVTVEGEAGIGKTRLVAEAASRVKAGRVLVGRCDEYLGGPFKPWQPIFSRRPPTPLDPTDDALLGEVFAGYHATPSAAEIGAGTDPEARRIRLFYAAARFLSALTVAEPVVVVLDDLQWADLPSVLLLRHLLFEGLPMPLTVVATIRGSAPEVLEGTIAMAARRGQVTRIDLTGLPSTDVHELLDASGIAASDDAVTWLCTETLGNPLFVTELVRNLGPGARLDPGAVDLPGSVRAAVEHRLRAASPDARAIIDAAAVLGTRVDGSVCGEVAALDVAPSILALDEAVERRILRANDDGMFEFVHSVVRDTVYGALDPARRLDAHRRAAVVLTARHEAGASDLLAELAWHWSAAGRFGDRHRAVRFHQQAGDEAARRLGYESASSHYKAALALLRSGTDDDELRAELLIAIAKSENHAGDVNAGKEACVDAAAIAERTGRDDLLIEAALAFGGEAPVGNVRDHRAADLLRQVLDTRTADERWAIVAARLARVDYWHLERSERRRLCDQADARALDTGDDRLRACVLTHRYWALDAPDELADRSVTADRLGDLARRLDDPELMHEAGKCRLHLQLELGDDDARSTARELAEVAARLGQREHLRLAFAYEAMVAGAKGRHDDAEQLAASSRDLLLKRGHLRHAHAAYFVQAFPWWWLQGRLGEFVSIAELFVDSDPDRSLWRVFRAWTYASAGRTAEAVDELRSLDLAAVIAAEPTLDTLALLATAADTALLLGSDDIELLYSALARYEDRICVVGQIACFGAATHHLGVLALALGDAERGVAHLRHAVATHERLGYDALTALSLAELARATRSARSARSDDLVDLVGTDDDVVDLRARATAIADARNLGRVHAALDS